MSNAPMPVSVPALDPQYRLLPLTPTERQQGIAAILALGIRRLLNTRHATSFSAGRSSPNLSEFIPSGLANSRETSVTVHTS
jgi:hypothetical protein